MRQNNNSYHPIERKDGRQQRKKKTQRPLKKAKKRNVVRFTHKHKYAVRKYTVSETTDETEQNGTELDN